MHFLKHFNVLASINFYFLYSSWEEKLSKLRKIAPTPIPEVEPGDLTSILMPSTEEIIEEQQLQGLTRKQHYSQYVQVAMQLGEAMPLGEDSAKEQMAKVIDYLWGAAHLRAAAWKMTGVGLCRLHMALVGSPAYEVFEVLQEHFLSEVQ